MYMLSNLIKCSTISQHVHEEQSTTTISYSLNASDAFQALTKTEKIQRFDIITTGKKIKISYKE